MERWKKGADNGSTKRSAGGMWEGIGRGVQRTPIGTKLISSSGKPHVMTIKP